MYQSLKLCLGATGISLCLYHGLSVLLFVIKGNTRIIQRPIRPAKRYTEGYDSRKAIPFIIAFLEAGAYPSAVSTCRHFHSCVWMSIFTGQTLLQEPQRVDAKGRSALAFMSRLGFKMDPIGPATAV